MSLGLEPTIIPQSVGGVVGWVFTAALGVFTLVTQMRKGKVDESAMVLGEWKKLFEAHKERVEALAQRVTDLESENAGLRSRVTSLEDQLSTAKKHEIELEEENAGLKRQIVQLADSGVSLLGQKPPGSAEYTEKTKEGRKTLDEKDATG